MSNRSPLAPVLVTGASGLVGRAVIRTLREQGYPVTALTHRNPPPADVRGVEGDITNEVSLRAALRGQQTVVHAAAVMQDTDERLHQVNVQGSEHLCRAARATGVDRVVWLSSASVYGSGPFENADESRPVDPSYPYARTKAVGERIARSRLGDRVTVLRPVTVYRTGACPFVEFLASVIRAGSLPRVDGLDPGIDLVHARDLAAAVTAAVGGAGAGGTFNVAGPAPAPYHRLGQTAAAVLDRKPDWVAAAAPGQEAGPGRVPADAFPGPLYEAATIPRTLSIERARDRLGYRPVHHWHEEIPRALAVYE